MAALVLALVQREDVRLTKLAAQLPGNVLQRSKVKQLHRFFKHIRLPEDVLAQFILSFADPTARLWLVIDRTNWRLGKMEINILLVAVILNGQALPLMWTLLRHGGSSSAAVRNRLMEPVLQVLPAKRIAGLLGDRESTLQEMVQVPQQGEGGTVYPPEGQYQGGWDARLGAVQGHCRGSGAQRPRSTPRGPVGRRGATPSFHTLRSPSTRRWRT